MRREYPLVSIVIPVYNGSNYLRDAIDSALVQTYPNVEVIVVNDGSCDDGATERIAISYGDRIRYYAKENGGVATALNRGIQEMKGDYFSWLSHDDMYKPDKIDKEVGAIFRLNDLTRIVYSEYDQLDVHSGRTTPIRDSQSYSIEQLTNSVFPAVHNLIHGCSLLIHRMHFDRVGIFDEKLVTTQDYDLWFRMFRHQRLVFVPEPLLISRQHEEQGSKTISRHGLEREELYLGFMNQLSEDEMGSMYGSPYNCYYQLSRVLKDAGLETAYRYAKQKFLTATVPNDVNVKLGLFNEQIKQFSDGKARQVCIFGAGNYGLRLLQELKDRQVQVDFFSDNDPSKWGLNFNQVECIEPAALSPYKENMLVLVAARTPGEIVKQLTFAGYPYVRKKQDLDTKFIEIPPGRQQVLD
ncbi:glycosyltransferase [Cohnella lupini]|uniref:Glycosyl transferase family 2 n=1 Tax=Cohnella lupini TaxID=1294267 RepID=A0A3D9I8V0_9BACL|nr:glycosyltransferase [Cohnella lupini]RED57586.1 glycosyl transferase family 2 [Cohnella lupini]